MGAKDKILGVVNEAVVLAIKGVDKMPGVRPDPKEILADIRKASGIKLDSIDEISSGIIPAEVLDQVANRYFTRNTLFAAGSGLAGIAGAAGIAGSITGLLAATVGLAHRLALVYGFDDALEPGNENLILIGLGSAAGINLMATPFLAGVGAGAVGGVIWFGPAASQATAAFVTRAVAAGLIEKTLAPVLAREIIARGFARTAGQMIPIFGAAIGTVANTAFLRIWGKRMKAFYREQHIATLEKMRLGQEQNHVPNPATPADA